MHRRVFEYVCVCVSSVYRFNVSHQHVSESGRCGIVQAKAHRSATHARTQHTNIQTHMNAHTRARTHTRTQIQRKFKM